MEGSIKTTEEFYDRIKEIMKDKTLQEISDLTGIDKSNLSKIINGKANPSMDTIFKILKALSYHMNITHYETRKIKNIKVKKSELPCQPTTQPQN